MWTKLRKKFFKEERTSDVDYLIVGLGNPGEKYKKTAHNIGFRIISLLREKENLPHLEKDNTLNSLISKGTLEDKKVVLLFPLTFMNRSGEAVNRAVKRFLNSTENLIVVHDDTDLLFGDLKFSYERGSGGHKGVQSIINHLKTKKFYRLRVGVKREEGKAIDTVLKNLPKGASKIEEEAAEKLKEKISTGPSPETIKK